MSSVNQIHDGETRRDFIKKTTLAAAALMMGPISRHRVDAAPSAKPKLPCYRRTLRLGQPNITEIDPVR
jgi:hypothetical protein